MSLRASVLCNTTIIRYLNKPTQSKTQLTRGVVNSFNTYYAHADTSIDISLGYLFSSATANCHEFTDLSCSDSVKLSELSIPISVTFSVGKYIGVGLSSSYTLSRVDSPLVLN
ncbi:MAG: hypothetical protein ACJA0E_001165 [Bermanella sp.]|jgi:hypothetical protein